MKTRNKIIILLGIVGIVLFIVVQGVIIPRNNQKHNQYIAEQQNPRTHDLNSILKYKNKYMGNASNIMNLFNTLPLNNIEKSFELFSDKLMLEVNYKDTIENINIDKVNKALVYNSTAAFALIDNLEVISYNFMGSIYKVLRTDIEKWYGEDLAELLNETKWKSKIQDKLEDNNYVNEFTKLVLIRK
ncbi:MAG: DUF4825 domain-containing protein [Clostridium sp.]